MATDQAKTRAKKFSDDEIMSLVDIVEGNKSTIFGALSSTLCADDKNKIWEKIAGQIYRSTRTRDEISKKWYNILAKHKPRIAEKISSARRTGGGPAQDCLDELEAKIFTIKGKEAFEGIESDIYLSLESPSSEIINDESMVVSPTAFQDSERKLFRQPTFQ